MHACIDRPHPTPTCVAALNATAGCDRRRTASHWATTSWGTRSTLLSTSTSFFPGRRMMSSSTASAREPNGSRASSTSRITSAVSTTSRRSRMKARRDACPRWRRSLLMGWLFFRVNGWFGVCLFVCFEDLLGLCGVGLGGWARGPTHDGCGGCGATTCVCLLVSVSLLRTCPPRPPRPPTPPPPPRPPPAAGRTPARAPRPA